MRTTQYAQLRLCAPVIVAWNDPWRFQRSRSIVDCTEASNNICVTSSIW